ncbi:MAG: UPF0149 family protein [Acidobacteriia bacterium]|nr:UPF0149 family protein [Terriglobia bacterium]
MKVGKPLSDAEIDELERFLDSDNAPEDRMNVSSLHGFLTALVVSPTFVPPSQWLAEAWGKEEPTFDSDEQAEHFLGLLLRLYDSISQTLEENPKAFVPILYECDSGEDPKKEPDVTAEDWCVGFSRGVGLCSPQGWDRLFQDDKARNMMAPIIAFTTADAMADVLEHAGKKVNRETLLTFLPLSVAEIYSYFREDRRSLARAFTADRAPTRATPRVGRNDPCPCGSGKKYKKCCAMKPT